jgi:large subunit ribosomal protein L29
MAKKAATADDIRTKTEDELGDRLTRLKKEQFNLRFQRANGQLENTSRVRLVRKEIARIKTVLSERHRKTG